MAIVGDLGQTYNSSVTMLHMYRAATTTNPTDKKATLAICAGDMSYADSKPERWDSWFALIEPLLSHVPLVTAAGNHEIETSDFTKQPPFVPYDHRFRNPWVEPTVRSGGTNAGGGAGSDHAAPLPPQPYRYDFGNSYYDFVHGITHVVVLNCYADTSRGSPQHAWFESVFEGRAGRPKFDRRVTPWLVVVSHCPLYNTFSAHQNEREATDTLKHMECLFLRYGVNLVFSGHTHGYSRSTELAYGEVVGGGGGGGTGRGRGPVYITVGEGGNREGHCRTYVNATVPEEWIIKRDITEYGFGTVDFINATTLHWKWVRNEDEDRFRFTDEVFLENQWLEEVEEEVEDEENVVDTVFSGVDYFSAVGNGIGPVMVQKA